MKQSFSFPAVLLSLGVFLGGQIQDSDALSKYLPQGVSSLSVGNIRLIEREDVKHGGIGFEIDTNGTGILQGQLGVSLPEVIEDSATNCVDAGGASQCLNWGDYATLKIFEASTENDNCARIEWTTTFGRRLEDCFDLIQGEHWYGGIQVFRQTFPIEGQEKSEMANVPGIGFGGVNENYWFTTLGVSIKVDEDVPLFTSMDSVHRGQFCLVAQDKHPFVPRGEVKLNYNLCTPKNGENLLDLHRRSLLKYYQKPSGVPDLTMLVRPFWSTWAQFHTSVDEQTVLNFSQRIKDEGFLLNSHVEIDDDWESCYGEAEFSSAKFPDPAGLVRKIKALGMKVTLWIHPFINFNCPSFKTAFENNYFVRDSKDKPAITSWWAGNLAGIIDFTNEDAVKWWTGRLRRLQSEYGIDSFKFDAGEYDSLPYSVKLNGDSSLTPNLHTTAYVKAVAPFGGMLEVRVGRNTQNFPNFVRMLDKNSVWGYDNGLQSVIPTLLHFSMLGYSFCLPDMIGGNAYEGRPSKELYNRWMQANVLMSAVQISIVPWEYDAETIRLTLAVLAIREEMSSYIEQVAQESVVTGDPMNRPMFFADPEDSRLWAIDNQYMLGDSVIVAPVVEEGQTQRDIYLPVGSWEIAVGQSSIVYQGPTVLTDFRTPLNTIPIFVKQNNRHNLRVPNSQLI